MDKVERFLEDLETICEYCENIANTIHRYGDRDEFMSDYDYQASCVFSLIQIGEAVKRNYEKLSSLSDAGRLEIRSKIQGHGGA